MAKFERDHPQRGQQMEVKWVKIGHFRWKMRYNSKTVQDRHIVSIKVVCVKNEGVLKVTGSHVHFRSGSFLKTVLDKDVETTVHKHEVICRTAI